MLMLVIFGLVAGALAVGAIGYLTVKLTVSFLKKYRRKKNSKIMAAEVKDLIKKAPTMKLSDLDDDDVILVEYDEDNDELVQDVSIANDVDDRISDILNSNGGIVVFD